MRRPATGARRRSLSDARLREEMRDVYHALARTGLSVGGAGNISARAGDRILISPTGADGDSIEPSDFVEIALDGKMIAGGRPSSEWALHVEIYRSAPARAVIHAHPDHCVALSCLRKSIPAFHYMIAAFGGDDIRCANYELFGARELALAAAAALTDRTACLLANHGMVAFGDDLQQALYRTRELETLARQYCLALQAGEPVLLTASEMRAVKQQFAAYRANKGPVSSAGF